MLFSTSCSETYIMKASVLNKCTLKLPSQIIDKRVASNVECCWPWGLFWWILSKLSGGSLSNAPHAPALVEHYALHSLDCINGKVMGWIAVIPQDFKMLQRSRALPRSHHDSQLTWIPYSVLEAKYQHMHSAEWNLSDIVQFMLNFQYVKIGTNHSSLFALC